MTDIETHPLEINKETVRISVIQVSDRSSRNFWTPYGIDKNLLLTEDRPKKLQKLLGVSFLPDNGRVNPGAS